MTQREVAQAIRALRRHFSRTELAAKLGVSDRCLSNWTKTSIRPRAETITRIEALLKETA